ncbi:MAG: metal dependent phosphohydrolase [Candidatus Peregrinibacteria bacterium GW2011_GWA2_33_10]|nr:MAG: metal dependent phosphohydrolase [Candidatus Peregrinibacteria bacterium GW2011_GWA2_33_10]KKP38189.1 MAG: polynucleotide adenylyltransferase/metal dependent phosphohydrolase [Candidatus Peregrinibacteria bacterium GW2011_GWC2_33_13]OGJ48774.1 MAG: hypothetical protein A2229_04210 [Candidatus Peregrinibacteria bacterium RIFOXYA2_FULL_33_7]
MQKTALKIVKKLRDAGFEAYFAGGYVRDLIMGKKEIAKDVDIVTNAKPDEIEKILEKTVPVGKQFGVILAIESGFTYEIATFRNESDYEDGRRPSKVHYTNAQEDAKRRDFTVNGIFLDPVDRKILDFVDGVKDIKARLIRFIGVPHERILEDHLRIIRAIRFKNCLNFGYHPDTYKALKKHAELSNKVSGERMKQEFDRIMMCENIGAAFEDMQDTGILKYILPEVEEMKGVPQPMMYHEEGDVWTHTMMCLEALPKSSDLETRYAMLFHDIGKTKTFKIGPKRIRFDGHVEAGAEIALNIMKRLKFSRKEMDKIIWLIKHHMMIGHFFQMNRGRRLHWFLKKDFKDLMEVFKADIKGSRPLDDGLFEKLKNLYEKDIKAVPKEPKRLLTGEDVMKILNLKPSEKVGEILEKLRHEQLQGRVRTVEEARRFVESNA